MFRIACNRLTRSSRRSKFLHQVLQETFIYRSTSNSTAKFENPKEADDDETTFANHNRQMQQHSVDLDFVYKMADFPGWASSPILVEIMQAKDIEMLLSVVEMYPLDASQARTLVFQSGKLKEKVDMASLVLDARFQKCIDIIVNVDVMTENAMNHLLTSYRSLLLNGLNADSDVAKRLQAAINVGLNKVAPVSANVLALFATVYVDHDTSLRTSSPSEFMSLIVAHLAQKMARMKNVSIMLLVLNKLCHKNCRHDDALLREVESALVQSVDRMTSSEMLLCLEYMAESGSRCADLLKPICLRLAADLSQLSSINQLVALLGNLKRLSYLQPFILAPLLHAINQNLPTMEKPRTLENLCHLLEKSSLRSPQTFVLLTNWLQENYALCAPKHLVAFVNSLAHCNFSPKDCIESVDTMLKEILTRIRNDVKQESIADSKFEWLRYVWSMCALEQLTVELAETVLNVDYLNRVLEIKSPLSAFIRAKLLNIHTGLQCDLKLDDLSGTKIVDPTKFPGFLDDIVITPSSRKIKAMDELFRSLSLLAPKGTYCKTQQFIPQGYTIDAEICIDDQGKAVPITSWTPLGEKTTLEKDDTDDSTRNAKENKAENSRGTKRVAFQIRDFNDNTLISQAYNGRHALADRHMTEMGYSIIPVTVQSLLTKDNILQRVADLKAEVLMSGGDRS